jgi:hypothetical protein
VAQYNIFSQLEGPKIDTYLFANSANAGITAGKNLPSNFTAGVNGLVQGIGQGQQIVQNQQAITANDQNAEIRQNQIDRIPEQNAEQDADLRLKELTIENNTLALENEKATNALKLENASAKLKADNAKLAQATTDISTQKQITEAINSNDPNTVRGIVTNPQFNDWMLRNPNEAGHVLGQIAPHFTPEEQQDLWKKNNFDKAMELQAREKEDNRQLIARSAESVDKAFNEARSQPELNAIFGPNADPKDIAEKYSVGPKMPDTGANAGKYPLQDADGKNVAYIESTAAAKYLDYQNSYKAKGALREQYYWPNGRPAPAEDSAAKGGQAGSSVPTFQAQGAAVGATPTPNAVSTNAEVNARITKKFEASKQMAVATGQTKIYDRHVARGQALVPTRPAPSPTTSTQSTPTPVNQVAITRPMSAEKKAELDSMFNGSRPDVVIPNEAAARSDFVLNNRPAGEQEKLDSMFSTPESREAQRYSEGARNDFVLNNTPDSAASSKETAVDIPRIKAALADTSNVSLTTKETVKLHNTYLQDKTTALLGTPTKISFRSTALPVETIQKINSIPALKGYNPIIKGMVAVESGGNPSAVGPVTNKKGERARGLMQLMPGTAKELGVYGKDVFDADKNVEAGATYLNKQMERINKALQAQTDKTGFPIELDIRFGLAAYNGGLTDVLNGISKGFTTWEELKPYLRSVKSAANYKQNVEYPDKVLAAAVAFMEGGNEGDDSVMKHMLVHGMVEA